jgi:hypothetical protein
MKNTKIILKTSEKFNLDSSAKKQYRAHETRDIRDDKLNVIICSLFPVYKTDINGRRDPLR